MRVHHQMRSAVDIYVREHHVFSEGLNTKGEPERCLVKGPLRTIEIKLWVKPNEHLCVGVKFPSRSVSYTLFACRPTKFVVNTVNHFADPSCFSREAALAEARPKLSHSQLARPCWAMREGPLAFIRR